MTDPTGIEAVLRELTAEVRYSESLNGPETHLKSLHRRALAAITDLQARVAAAEGDMDRWAGLVCLAQEKHEKMTAQLTASQAEVARLKQGFDNVHERWTEQATRNHQLGEENRTLSADLAAHKAAVAEAVAVLEKSDNGNINWLANKLRALAEPAKHAEAILRAAFPSMNFAITTTAASQPSVLTAIQSLWNEAHDAGALAMREAAANGLFEKRGYLATRDCTDILAIDPASLRSE